METSGSHRAGVLRPTPEGYATFEPSPLPPAGLRLDGQTHGALARAERAMGYLSGQVAARPRVATTVAMACRREAVASCRLDGSTVTMSDLLWWELDGPRADRLTVTAGEVRICANCARLLSEVASRGEAQALDESAGPPASRKWLCEVHRRLFRGLRGRDDRPGRIRSTVIWLGPRGSTAPTASFVPPAPETIAEHLDRLQEFLRAPPDLPPVACVALAFGQLESIHPFVDGSGRVCRLALVALLADGPSATAWPQLLCPSTWLAEGFGDHFRRLQDVRFAGDYEGWIRHFAEGLAQAAGRQVEHLAQLDEQLREHEERISGELPGLAQGAIGLLSHLAAHPLVSVPGVARLCQRSFANANILVSRLAQMGLLSEITGRKRNRRYVYSPYLDIT